MKINLQKRRKTLDNSPVNGYTLEVSKQLLHLIRSRALLNEQGLTVLKRILLCENFHTINNAVPLITINKYKEKKEAS